jgi:hypothetical protein
MDIVQRAWNHDKAIFQDVRSLVNDALGGYVRVFNVNVKFEEATFALAQRLDSPLTTVDDFKMFVRYMIKAGCFDDTSVDKTLLDALRRDKQSGKKGKSEDTKQRKKASDWLCAVGRIFKAKRLEKEDSDGEMGGEEEAAVGGGGSAAAAAPKAAKATKARRAALEREAKANLPVQPVPVEQLLAAEAAAAAARAARAAPTPRHTFTEDQLRAFSLDGRKYIRPWSSVTQNWATGDLWYTNKKGEKAAYWGVLLEDGSVNADPEEPEILPAPEGAALVEVEATPAAGGGGSFDAARAAAAASAATPIERQPAAAAEEGEGEEEGEEEESEEESEEEDAVVVTVKITRKELYAALAAGGGGCLEGASLAWCLVKQSPFLLDHKEVAKGVLEQVVCAVEAVSPGGDLTESYLGQFVECWACGYIATDEDDEHGMCGSCSCEGPGGQNVYCSDCVKDHVHVRDDEGIVGSTAWRLKEIKAHRDALPLKPTVTE